MGDAGRNISVDEQAKQIFRTFSFNPDRASLNKIEKAIQPGLLKAKSGVSLSAVDFQGPNERKVHDYIRTLYTQINGRGGETAENTKLRQRLAKYVLARALLISKIQEGKSCVPFFSALSPVGASKDRNTNRYKSFVELFGFHPELSIDNDKHSKFRDLQKGTERGGKALCQGVLNFFKTDLFKEAWMDNFSRMMNACFKDDAAVSECVIASAKQNTKTVIPAGF